MPKGILFLLVLWIIIGGFAYYKDSSNPNGLFAKSESELRCGIVQSDASKLRNLKHGTTTDFYLIVKYEDGVIVEEVDAQTYFTNPVGSRVCFRYDSTTGDSIASQVLLVWICITGLIVFIVALMYFIDFIGYLNDL